MKKVISIIMTAAMVVTAFSGSAFAGNSGKDKIKGFLDLEGHWGKQSIMNLQSLGILGGYSDGTFKPDKTLTQGELAVIISRILEVKDGHDNDQDLEDDQDLDDEEAVENEDLSDVPAWAKDAVAKGYQKQYLNMKRFHSQVQCDRLTACVALAKALELEPVTGFSDNPFGDRDLISDQDYGYLLALYKEGYIKGFPDGKFHPNYVLNRAQIAAIIDKLMSDDEEVTDEDNAPYWHDKMITASAIDTDSVKLTWSGAEDDVAVTGYKVSYELNGHNKVGYTTSKSAIITGLEANVEYTFTVQARDAAGNWSDDGPSIEVKTLKVNDTDTTAPTWPDDEELTVSALNSSAVTILWPDAEDTEGVTAYKFYKNGTLIKTLDYDVNSINVTGLNPNKDYTFAVTAVDAAGNESEELVAEYN